VRTAAQDGLPAHELECGLWRQWLQLGAILQAQYFALAGDGDQGERLALTDGRVVKRLPERHVRPYRSIFGEFALERVVYGTREGQRIEAAPPDARLGLPEIPSCKRSCKLKFRVERLAGLEDGEGDVDQLAHRDAGDGLAVFSVGFEALAEGTDNRIVPPGDQRGHVQGFSQSGVASFGNACFPHPFAGLLNRRCEADIGYGLLGVGEAIMGTQRGQRPG
jgi:hypothetical protein